MLKGYTCIVCPNGCEIKADIEEGRVISIDGALCPKGKQYVWQELTDPRRNIASSVLVENGVLPLVSVRLDKAIPKNKIFDVMEEIKKARLGAPIKSGQVVIQDVLHLGSNVIATKNVDAV